MKKITTIIEKIFNPYALLVLNILIMIVVEFAGGGQFFATTGLIHAVAVVFVGLIVLQIFSDYAFSDYILRGFLRIQLAFFLFLGLIHVYEYFAEHVFMMREDVVGLTVVASYFLWFFSNLLALRYVLRIYYKKSILVSILLSVIVAICFAGLAAPSISVAVVAIFPSWFPKLILLGIVTIAALGVYYVWVIQKIMPIFRIYSYCMISASILLVLTSFSEYFEGTTYLEKFGISSLQNLYISHFLVFAALSLLFIGFNRLKKPAGIYADM